MENLKKLLGSAYHEGLTIEEVNTYLDGKKFVDLKDGGYVAKEKFDTLQIKFSELETSTKDYETIVKEHQSLKAEKEVAETRKSLIEAGVNEKFIDYVQFNIEKGKIAKDEKFVDNVKGFLKENPQYGKVESKPKIVFSTKVGESDETKDGDKDKVINQTINESLRGQFAK